MSATLFWYDRSFMRYWQETVFWLPFRSFCISGLDCGAGVGFRQIFVLNFLLDNCMGSIFVCYLFLIRLLIYEIFAKNCFLPIFASFLIFFNFNRRLWPRGWFWEKFWSNLSFSKWHGEYFCFLYFFDTTARSGDICEKPVFAHNFPPFSKMADFPQGIWLATFRTS